MIPKPGWIEKGGSFQEKKLIEVFAERLGNVLDSDGQNSETESPNEPAVSFDRWVEQIPKKSIRSRVKEKVEDVTIDAKEQIKRRRKKTEAEQLSLF